MGGSPIPTCPEIRHARRRGNDLLQRLQPFAFDLGTGITCESRDVSSGSGEASRSRLPLE